MVRPHRDQTKGPIMSALTPWHLLILLVLVILLFSAKKLPELARNVGQSTRILKAEMRGLQEDAGPDRTTPHRAGPPKQRDAHDGSAPSSDDDAADDEAEP